MQLDSIRDLVKKDFLEADKLIYSSLQSKASIINDLGHHITQAGGKRLRPLVVLLIAHACGYTGNQHIPMAVSIELIHTATLLHDDVVDDATLRRGKQTANHVWGNVAAVLVGDFLYSRAFQILADNNHPQIIKIISNAANVMAEGEALQLLERHNSATTEGAYFDIIRSKTAKLFETAAMIGPLLSNASPDVVSAMELYGMHLGTAFQLIDDLLDYTGNSSKSGKEIGNDLSQGKVTLPLIHILETGTPSQIQIIRHAIKEGGIEALSQVKKIIEETGGIEYTFRFAQTEVQRAQKALNVLKDSPFKQGVYDLAQFALERKH